MRKNRFEKKIITVEGMYDFPIDMLRYDRCTPFLEEDSEAIKESFFEPEIVQQNSDYHLHRKIRLLSDNEPTRLRWQNLGWTVTDVRTWHLSQGEENALSH